MRYPLTVILSLIFSAVFMALTWKAAVIITVGAFLGYKLRLLEEKQHRKQGQDVDGTTHVRIENIRR